MAAPTRTEARTLNIQMSEGGGWVNKNITANSIAEGKAALECPSNLSININGTIYTDNNAPWPQPNRDADGNEQPFLVAFQANTKTGGQ
tara:strand:- start:6367 stop:6633 length:267 start_codon:yes stop_codon:yes gene_type:complete